MCDKCKNPEAFPPFLALEGVISTDAGEFGMIAGVDMEGGIDDDVTRSITEYKVVLALDIEHTTPGSTSRGRSALIRRFFQHFLDSPRMIWRTSATEGSKEVALLDTRDLWTSPMFFVVNHQQELKDDQISLPFL